MTQDYNCVVERNEHGLNVYLQSEKLHKMFNDKKEMYYLLENGMYYNVLYNNDEEEEDIKSIINKTSYENNEYFVRGRYSNSKLQKIIWYPHMKKDLIKGISFNVKTLIPDIIYKEYRQVIQSSLNELIELHNKYIRDYVIYSDMKLINNCIVWLDSVSKDESN